jgi:hypothetical protein
MKLNLYLPSVILILLLSTVAKAQLWGEGGSRTDYRDNASLPGSEGAVSGFFQTSSPSNYPAGATGWWHLLDVRHSNPNNNFSMQFAGGFYDQNLWFRKIADNPAQPWSKVVLEKEGAVRLKLITFEGEGGNSYQDHRHYGIYQEKGDWAHPYPDLVFNYHTGIKMVGYHNYGGIRFYGGYADDATPTGEVLSVANGDYHVRVANRLFVADKLGIGTENTGENRLSVNGNIRAKEIKVEAAPWPDYVFNASYKLPSLQETEQFIKANHHLPDIPSAAEVEKDGVNLGEMNARLLKKIEELTLHLIEQSKLIQSQAQALEAQDRRVQRLETISQLNKN